MGYHAYATTDLQLKPNVDLDSVREKLEEYKKHYGDFAFVNFYKAKNRTCFITFEYQTNWHEEDVEAFCKAFQNDIKKGEYIFFEGDDSSHWRYMFTGDNYEYENAMTVFKSDLTVETKQIKGGQPLEVSVKDGRVYVSDCLGNEAELEINYLWNWNS